MKIFIFIFLNLLTIEIIGESFYNVNGFYGERDSGMGGAYAAVSDDAAGMFYNPAGLGFSFYDTITTSSINYNATEKSFQDVLGPSKILGPSQDYVRNSRGFNPSFIGVMKSFDKLKVGFAIFNPITEHFDQFNNSYQPVYQKGISEAKIKYTEDNSKYIFGPSFAYSISSKLSIGTSILAFDDKSRSSSSVSISGDNGQFVNQSISYNRSSNGVIPVLGIQYMPFEKVSLGISARRTINLYGTERKITQDMQGSSLSAKNINFEDSSQNAYGAYYGVSDTYQRAPVNLYGNSNLNGKIPETHEIRSGIAVYPSKSVLFAFDLIYTSSYHLKDNLYKVDPNKKYFVLSSSEHANLRTNETLNYACGMEIYISEFLSLRLGTFSNKANTGSFSNSETAKMIFAEAFLRALSNQSNQQTSSTQILASTGVSFDSGNGSLVLELPSLSAANSRNEHVNLQGLSLGLAYETSKSTVGISIVHQAGGGRGRLTSVMPNDLHFKGDTVYIISTIKN